MMNHYEILSRNFEIIYSKFSWTILASLLITTIGSGKRESRRPVRKLS